MFCLNQKRAVLLATAAGVLAAMPAESANFVRQTSVSPRIRSVVRADSRGRLVRTIVVTHRAITPQASAKALDPVASASSPAIAAVETNTEIPALVEAAAKKYSVDPLLVHSVIQVESNYNPYAVSPKGAQGLMQLMPGTARRFGVSNAFDPADNIEGGVRYLAYLSSLFPQDPRLAIAAYNAGEGAVWKYNYQIPPYRETEQYVQKVAHRYGKARRQTEQTKPSVMAVAAEPQTDATAQPAGPVYAPIDAYVDSNGILHMRTVEGTGGSAVTQAP